MTVGKAARGSLQDLEQYLGSTSAEEVKLDTAQGKVACTHRDGKLYATFNGKEYSIDDVRTAAATAVRAIGSKERADTVLAFLAAFTEIAEGAGKSKGVFQRVIGSAKGSPDIKALNGFKQLTSEAKEARLGYVFNAAESKRRHG